MVMILDSRRMDFDLMEMFVLRRAGWSYSSLGRKYRKDHTTIMHHCKKHAVVPLVPVFNPRENNMKMIPVMVVEKRFVPGKYDAYLAQQTNPGKSYKQYLAEAKKRPIEKDYLSNHRAVFL